MFLDRAITRYVILDQAFINKPRLTDVNDIIIIIMSSRSSGNRISDIVNDLRHSDGYVVSIQVVTY